MSINSWIRRQFKNNVSTTDYIPAGLSAGATSFTAFDGSTFPDGSVGPFTVTVDQGLATEERIQCLSRTNQNFIVNTNGRGYNGTTAQIHMGNCSILHTADQQDFDEANQTAFQTLGAIQAKGDLLVGSSANNLTRLPIGATNTFAQVQGGTLAYQAFGSGQSQTISTNGDGTQNSPARSDHSHLGVASFNTRTGAVTFTLADAETVFTAAGGLLVGTGSGTGELLAKGTTNQVLSVGGADPSGLQWITPNSPGSILALTDIGSPGYATTSTTLAIVDGTNAKLTFTVPPSGKVLLTAYTFWNNSAAGRNIGTGWSSANTSNANLIGTPSQVGNVDGGRSATIEAIASGLTPGASFTAYLQWYVYGVAGTVTINNTDLILKAIAL